mgnify:CR=1 FL=1
MDGTGEYPEPEKSRLPLSFRFHPQALPRTVESSGANTPGHPPIDGTRKRKRFPPLPTGSRNRFAQRSIGRRRCLGKATRPPTRTGRPSRNGGKTKPIDDTPLRPEELSGSHRPPEAMKSLRRPRHRTPPFLTGRNGDKPDRPIQIHRGRSVPSDKKPFTDTGSGRRPKNPNRPRSRTPKTFRRTRPVRRSSKDTIAGTRTPASRQSLRGKTPPAKRRRTSIFFPTMKTAGDFPPHSVGFVPERPCRRTARAAGRKARKRQTVPSSPAPAGKSPVPDLLRFARLVSSLTGKKSARQCSAAKQATSNRAKAADFGTERPKPGVYGMPQDSLGAGASAPVSSPADAGERNRDTNEKGEARILRRTRASPVRSVNVAGRPLRTPARPDYSISIISA